MADSKRARRRTIQLTARDLQLLRFVAEQRLVLAGHVQALLGVSAPTARARLGRLAGAGYLSHDARFHRKARCYQATRAGLAAVGSGYQTRKIDLNLYRHDVGVAWISLAAQRGTFGPMREVIGERRMRSQDASRLHDAEPFEAAEPSGVRLGGHGAGGRERLHYPDLLLVTPEGKRIAVELELSAKGRTRREKILAGYAGEERVDAVLYLVEHENQGLARSIQASARRAGIGAIVQVQPVRWGEASKREGNAPAAERSRAEPSPATDRTARQEKGLER